MKIFELVDEYVSQKTWLVRENANLAYSFSALFMRLAGEAISQYMLKKVYPKGVANAHLSGDFHIHNLYMGNIAYCAGWSITDLLLRGFSGVGGRIESRPPKHFSTALLQLANFLGTMQNEFAGAQAVNSLDTLLAPFVAADRLRYKEVRQHLQQFVYNLNVASRWGQQTPFTNISFDLVPPRDLRDKQVIVGGKSIKDTYADYQDEMDAINQAFCEVMLEGDARQRIFTFPLPTYNITKDFAWDSEAALLIFELAAKYGAPYFYNYVSSNLDPREIRAMCCRLLLDARQLYHRHGYFGYADKVGSVGVVTINMPRAAYLARDDDDFFKRLARLMDLAKESLETKRAIVQRNIDAGLLPYTKAYLGTLRWHFSTIGVVGFNEACLNFIGKDIASREGKSWVIRVLKWMRARLIDYQRETGNPYNLEATPAEGVSYRLALLDKRRWPRIATAGEKEPYYTSSSWLPVNYTDDIFSALEHQDDLQPLYTGGTVFHGFLGESISGEAAKLLVHRIVSNFRIPYITLTPTFSICPEHGYLSGEQQKCPRCGKICEIYSRIVGYYRPVGQWNAGKQEEYKQRLAYRVA